MPLSLPVIRKIRVIVKSFHPDHRWYLSRGSFHSLGGRLRSQYKILRMFLHSFHPQRFALGWLFGILLPLIATEGISAQDPEFPFFGDSEPAFLESPREAPLPPPPAPPALVEFADEAESSDSYSDILRRLEQTELRLRELELERESWLHSLQSNHYYASPSASDVAGLDPSYLRALRNALEDSPRAKPSINVTGQLQIDSVTFNQSDVNKEAVGELENATGFRRARLGAFGELFETTEYRIEFDFAGNGRPRFLDNWIAIKDVPYLKNMIVGHFFEPFSLERYTPNRFITFLERSSVDVFAPARNTGMMIFGHNYDENVIWAFGVFRTNSDTFGDSVNDSSDYAGTGHLTWLPYYDDESNGRELLHLGASFSMRYAGDKVVRFRKRPENDLQAFEKRDFPVFADTGDIAADSFMLMGVEAAWVHGPFSLQSEAVATRVNRLDGPNPMFVGYYAMGSYFLTGENRSYARTTILGRFREGIFQRITPNTNAFKGNVDQGMPAGIGAWELAARWQYIDLNSQDIQGNRLGTLTLGVNWYLNPNTRVQFNYLRPLLKSADTGRSHADIVGVRFGFEF
jgi:phosphate-selective porin OprO and OprP